MAGTAITKNLNQTANLNIPSQQHSTSSRRQSCLCLEQPKVVEQNNDIAKYRLMKENSTDYCHNSSCRLNRILTNNYNNIKTHQHIQRPATLCWLIIMSLTILLTQMPAGAQSKAISRHITLELVVGADDAASSADSSSSSSSSASSSQLSAQDAELLLLSSEELVREAIVNSKPDSSSSDSLTSIEVLKHFQRNQQHQKERRTRLRKRHISDLEIRKYLDDKSPHNLEWKNPCGVQGEHNQMEKHASSQENTFNYLKHFHHTVQIQRSLLRSAPKKIIKINDMNVWQKHKGSYKFLPQLKRNGTTTLSRYYRNMQIYVASFGHLARTQYRFDKAKQVYAGDISEELNDLLTSARLLLCELEITINGSSPNSNVKKLKTFSRAEMDATLQNFKTKESKTEVVTANTLDLKFTKYSYMKYLSNMQAILKRNLRSKSKKLGLIDDSNEDQSSLSNVVEGDDSGSVNINSINQSDSNLSAAQSFEILMNPPAKPQHKLRRHLRRKSSELPQF